MSATESQSLPNLQAELEQYKSRVAALRALQNVAREVTAELDLNRLLHKILRAAVTVLNCTGGSLLLYDPSTAELVFEVVEGGGGQALEKMRIRADQGIAGAVFTQGSPLLVENAQHDERHLGEVAGHFGLQVSTLLAVPLSAQGRILGVLELVNKISHAHFDEDDRDLLLAFASQSAIAIENARLYRHLRQERDRIASVEAAVRREVSRDLHDGPAQILSAIVMDVQMLPDVYQHSPERISTELAELQTLSDKALHQIRNILFMLRPVVLERDGLGGALTAYVERVRPLERFNLTLDMGPLTTRFDPTVESVLFSIVQEAVSNAKKHAVPRNVSIQAHENEGYLELMVQDDGCGFDPAKAEQTAVDRNSFGLLNMRERAEVAHAELRIESERGRGTCITLRVPLEQRPQDEG